LLGSVRRALTIAINRAEIVDAYVRPFGRECFAPISPIFRWAYNDTLEALPYEPDIAKKLLLAEGWRDANGDGILEQRGRKFAFTLKVPSGNELRTAIAAVVQAKLREIGIDVKIELVERAAFWESVMDKKFDACIAGFSVPLQMQLDELWGSNLQRSRFNIASFRNERVDAILAGAKSAASDSAYAGQWKEFQSIIKSQQPCTFLYWMNDLVAINKRVEGTDIGVLGIMRHAERWQIPEVAAAGSR
jgi:peptide/nickel transport system substrate-binding protein